MRLGASAHHVAGWSRRHYDVEMATAKQDPKPENERLMETFPDIDRANPPILHPATDEQIAEARKRFNASSEQARRGSPAK